MRITTRTLVFSVLGILFILGCGGGAAATEPVHSTATEPIDLPAPGDATGEPIIQPTESSSSEATPSAVPAFTPQPALPERRRLTLEFPPRIRAGDSDVVRLMLEVDDLGNVTPTAEIGGNVVTGEVIEIPNLYETHHVIAEARFDIAGMEVRPPDLASEPLSQGTSATFYWSIRPQEAGDYRGTIWLYLRFVDKASGAESRKTVSAQTVEIEAVNFLGLSGEFARMTGVVGSVVGTILGFPFLEDVVKFLFKKRSKNIK